MQFVERPDHAARVTMRRTRLTARSPQFRQAPRLLGIPSSPIQDLLDALAALAVERSLTIQERRPAEHLPPSESI